MQQREYRQDLIVSKFLSGLSPSLRSQVRDQILEGDNIFTLTATFPRVISFLLELVSLAPSIVQSAMVSGRGRGRGRCRDFGGESGLFGGGRGSYGGRQTVGDKGPM